jgi:endonuclease III
MTRPNPRAERVAELLRRLPRIYPDAHCELNFKNPLELLVATILSAQCTDKRVNMVTGSLFARYRTAANYAGASIADLEQAVKTTGFFRNKAKNIRAACAQIVALHGGEVPRSMEALAALPGVGRKTANVVLGNAFGIAEGVVVDTHVGRLSRRLGLTRQDDAEKVERDLMKLIPRERWTIWSHWLIFHGRRHCFARNPDCLDCELLDVCPTGKKKAVDRS